MVEEDGTITSTDIFPFKGHSAASHAMDLGAKVTNLLICDQIKDGTRLATAEANIRLLTGNTGNADECVRMHIEQKHHLNTGMWGKGTQLAGGDAMYVKKKEWEAKRAESGNKGGGLRSLFGKKDK